MAALWAPAALRLLRVSAVRTAKALRSKLANASRPAQSQLENATLHTAPGRQAIHPLAALRQQRRWRSTTAQRYLVNTVRRYMSSGTTGPRIDRSKFPTSNTSRRISQFTGRAPFASTMRPNLTGGAIPRTQGGYTLGGGGGVRYFSHTPVAPAEVVNNVSAAVRAFWLSGHRARFDGVDSMGYAKYRAVSVLEDETTKKMSAFSKVVPGSFIDFQLSPTITAISPLTAALPFSSAVVAAHARAGSSAPVAYLNADVIDELSGDFARAFKELGVIFSDIQRLSALGDLPIVLHKPDVLRIRFPGVDVETARRLCDDLDIRRGRLGEDPEFGAMMGIPVALKFPFAPESEAARTMTSPGGSLRSMDSEDVREAFMELEDNPSFSSPEGYETMSPGSWAGDNSEDYEGLEGIYRFLQECDRSRPTFR
ncbi:uncharacterized protein DNG_00533 [Cephalotrichum gorgonifer]|uniref:Casein kinase II beta 2 subunit n=1 Tax=Cephalotrichum gorgonifer TaxID=2041049 RepID=A0AAE8MPJ8_9PEZI|nr:uncharacterized protein DNG_00533 [Cephalotrichum gorgonifer]